MAAKRPNDPKPMTNTLIRFTVFSLCRAFIYYSVFVASHRVCIVLWFGANKLLCAYRAPAIPAAQIRTQHNIHCLMAPLMAFYLQIFIFFFSIQRCVSAHGRSLGTCFVHRCRWWWWRWCKVYMACDNVVHNSHERFGCIPKPFYNKMDRFTRAAYASSAPLSTGKINSVPSFAHSISLCTLSYTLTFRRIDGNSIYRRSSAWLPFLTQKIYIVGRWLIKIYDLYTFLIGR